MCAQKLECVSKREIRRFEWIFRQFKEEIRRLSSAKSRVDDAEMAEKTPKLRIKEFLRHALMETHSESPFYTRVAAAHMRRGQTVKYPRRVEYSLFIQSIPSARARALRRIRGRARFIFAAIKITRRSVFSVRLNMVLVKFFSGYIV